MMTSRISISIHRVVRLLRRVSVALIISTLAFPAFSAEQKIALVIGNAAYPTSKLRNPVNDAKAMAEKLKSLGFEVILRTDSNLRDMTRSFSQFGGKLTPGSVSLFYYAGHGMQVRGKNYLIPVDAEIDNEASVTSEAVDVDQLLNQLGPARLSMVILDACRNNPFERRFRGTGGGLAQIDAPTGTMLAYATAPGKVAADGTGSNGLYTEALLKALDMPGLKVEDVFKQVRINVVKASDGLQTPWESSSLTGEFYFRTPVATQNFASEEALRKAQNERAELQQALEEERKKRNAEAEVIKQEMERLRAELAQIRRTPSATTVAAVPPPIAPPVQAGTAQPSAPTVIAAASLTPPSTDWAQRLALIKSFEGTLTLSKALALLLDISNPEDLTAVVALDKNINGRPYHVAFALGTSAVGKVVWSGTWQWRLPSFAADSAIEQCQVTQGTVCKVVSVNGDFNAKEFMEFASTLAPLNLENVRREFVNSIRTLPEPVMLVTGSTGSPPRYAYSSPR